MSTSHIQSVPDKPSRFQRVKQYVKDNKEPLGYGILLGVAGVIVYVQGTRLDKDLLVLRRKNLKRFTAPPVEGNMPGVEYNVRGTRMWLIPALLPENETPYL